MPLSAEVRAAAISAICELLPKWRALAAVDNRRIHRRVGPGQYSISIEPYRGWSTLSNFTPLIRESISPRRLAEAIATTQPELTRATVATGQEIDLQDCHQLLISWCHALGSLEDEGSDIPQVATRLVDQFETLVDRRSIKFRTISAISGLMLPSSEFELRLAPDLTLRELTERETVEMMGQDISIGIHHDVLSHSVSSALVIDEEVRIYFNKTSNELETVRMQPNKSRDTMTAFFRALHILKTGRAGLFLTATEYIPPLLPIVGGTFWPTYRVPHASYALLKEDISRLSELLTALESERRNEVLIAADRLVDAETRLSPVDALLDATIGLEALLNPSENVETGFRMALNYAFLVAPALRRQRYDQVRDIQRTRNRIVHGGLNLQSSDAALIHAHATIAKECLRDAVGRFLLSQDLKGSRRNDSTFWIDRIIPANTSQA